MTPTQTPISPALVLRRTYRVSPERLFEAWTNPEIVATFLAPPEHRATNVRMDVRPGGTYSIGMLRPDGDTWVVGGTYREVRRPRFLSMTWKWEEDDPAQEHESLLTLEFNPVDGGTELILTHERFASEESRDGHERGWGEILEQLATVYR